MHIIPKLSLLFSTSSYAELLCYSSRPTQLKGSTMD